MRRGMFDHVQTRVDIWLDPWSDQYGKGWQIEYDLAVRHRRWWRRRAGSAAARTIPYAESDFIFAAIGEEARPDRRHHRAHSVPAARRQWPAHALRTDRTFEKLLATGLTTIVGVQAFIIMGGVVQVVPLTGATSRS